MILNGSCRLLEVMQGPQSRPAWKKKKTLLRFSTASQGKDLSVGASVTKFFPHMYLNSASKRQAIWNPLCSVYLPLLF